MEVDLETIRIQHERETEADSDSRCGHLLDNGDCLFLGKNCLHYTTEAIEGCDYWEDGCGGDE